MSADEDRQCNLAKFDPNEYIEGCLGRTGRVVGRFPYVFCIGVLCMTIGFASLLPQFYRQEQDLFNLWTPTDSPALKERKFIDEYWANNDFGILTFSARDKKDKDILDWEIIEEWLAFHMACKERFPQKNYTYNSTITHELETVSWAFVADGYYPVHSLDYLGNRSGTKVKRYHTEVVPICRPFSKSPLEAQFDMPCYALQIFDCFAEGGFNFPFDEYLAQTFITQLLPESPYQGKPSYRDLTSVELGSILGPSCRAFTNTVIPSNYLYGGEKRIDEDDPNSAVTSMKGLQTIWQTDSGFGIDKKMKIVRGACTYTSFLSIDCPPPTDKELDDADEFVDKWLKGVIDELLDIVDEWDKDDDKRLSISFFTPRTTGDLLSDASSADLFLLTLAYVVMIIFAALTAFKPKDLFLSRSEVSSFGVILVLLAVMATMGLGAVFWPFTANVVQVLPFIALGFGVDDMFVLLFSFHFRAKESVEDMIEDAVRVAGSSVTLTSTANTCAFAIASYMVLPEVARFARFGLLMVMLNFITVVFGFTSVLALLARRMKNGYVDWAWCCCWMPFTKAKEIKSEKPPTHDSSIFDPLFDFLTRDDIRIICVCLFFGFAAVGIYGSTLVKVGLPLDDIVPEDSYARPYLKTRTDYFHSYLNYVYSDAKLDELKPINWSYKFEAWYNATETIYDMSDLVYTDPSVHTFWAWDYREYVADSHDTFFNDEGYPLQTAIVEETTDFGRSCECEVDRLNFCPSLFVNYSYSSPLWNCLSFNYEELSDAGCQGYLDTTTPPPDIFAVPRQIEVVSPFDDTVQGVYRSPSDDTTNVFFRDDGAVIYQRFDNSWAILDNQYQLQYFCSEATRPGSEPPSATWYYGNDENYGGVASITTIYFDTVYFYRGAERGDDFTLVDIEPRSVFEVTYEFINGDANDGGCYALEVLQKSMSETTSFGSVTIASSVGDGSHSTTCDAVLEATEICESITFENDFGFIQCGAVETTKSQTRWWVGDCDGTFTVAGTDAGDASELDADDGCFCQDDAATSGLTMNYASHCGGSNFGGFNIDTSSDECSTESQDITFTCNAWTDCTELEACFDDITHGDDDICSETSISQYVRLGISSLLAECLLQSYDTLSACCQEATREQIIYQYSCEDLALLSDNSESVCSLVDQCYDDCTQICYADKTTDLVLDSDCNDEIEAYCLTEWESGDSSAVEACLNAESGSLSSCCSSTLARDSATFSGCLVPRDTYYDFDSLAYDFSDCNETNGTQEAGCGVYTGLTDQLDCMLLNYQSLGDGCCRRAMAMIDPSNLYTRDCQGDIARFCMDEDEYAAEISQECLTAISTALTDGDLSPNCEESVTYCGDDGDWPRTEVGNTASIACPAGYDGLRHRECVLEDIAVWSDVVNASACTVQYCAEFTDEVGQTWLDTPVGNVASYLASDVAFGYRSTCGGDIGYVSRLCWVDDEGQAEWRNATAWCRGIYGTWGLPVENRLCDTSYSSLIYAIDMATLGPTDEAISQCQSVCDTFFDHCQGFVHDTTTNWCFGFDWCEFVDIPLAATGNVTLYYYYENPTTISEFVAYWCSLISGRSAELETISPSEAYDHRGIPHPNCFNMVLWQYLVDPTGGVLAQKDFYLNNVSYLYDTSGLSLLEIVSTSNQINTRGIDDDEVAVEFILDYRKHLDKYFNDEDLYVIPGGLVIDLYTQYIGVEGYLILNLLYVSIAVLVTGFVFLLHPVAVGVVLLCDAVMIVEVYGFVDWAGLRMNGVLTLNMVIAIGLTMEFTAHMNRAFMIATAKEGEKIGIPQAGPGQIRMKKCLREMFTPVTLGAVTTLLGISPISAAQFPYFRQYYFVLYVLIVLWGWVNGVIFQPIILSILNPRWFGKQQEDEDGFHAHPHEHIEMIKSTSGPVNSKEEYLVSNSTPDGEDVDTDGKQ